VPASAGDFQTGAMLGAPGEAMGNLLGGVAKGIAGLAAIVAEKDDALALAHAKATTAEDQSKFLHDFGNSPYADENGLPKRLTDEDADKMLDELHTQFSDRNKGLSDQNQQALEAWWQSSVPRIKKQVWGLQDQKRGQYLTDVVEPRIASMGRQGMEVPAFSYMERVIPLYPESQHFNVRQRMETAYFDGTLKVVGSKAARAVLTANPSSFTPEVYRQLEAMADDKEREEYSELMSRGLERVYNLVVGDINNGIAPQPEVATNVLTDLAAQLKQEDRGKYIRSGMHVIVEALLNEDANRVKDFCVNYKPLLDPGDYATFMRLAQHAIDHEGGSTDTKKRALLAEGYALLPSAPDFAAWYKKSGPLLTSQSRSELMHAFSQRDNIPASTDWGKVADLLTGIGDGWATGDSYDSQRDMTEARVGDLRGVEVDLAEEAMASGGIPGFSQKKIPVLDRDTYERLQKVARAKVPPEAALWAREGFAEMQRLLRPATGWDQASGTALLKAAQELTNWVAKQTLAPDPDQAYKQVYAAAHDISIAVRPPTPTPASVVVAKPKAKQTLVSNMVEALKLPPVKESPSAVAMEATNIFAQPETAQTVEQSLGRFYANLSDTDKTVAAKIWSQTQSPRAVLEQVGPTQFPEWFWKQIEKNDSLRGDVLLALSRGAKPAEIMLNAQKMGGK